QPLQIKNPKDGNYRHYEHHDLNEKWRRFAAGIIIPDEVGAYRIMAWRDKDGVGWLALGIGGIGRPVNEGVQELLLVAQAGGKVCTHATELPEVLYGFRDSRMVGD